MILSLMIRMHNNGENITRYQACCSVNRT